MTTPSVSSKKVWVLPIVLAIAALMVLPGGTFLAAGAHSGALSNAGLAPATGGTSTAVNSALTSPFGTRSSTPVVSPSSIPADLQNTPWIKSLTHQTKTMAPLASYPNLAILQHATSAAPTAQVNPFYTAQPAPLGLADYGLGATTYSYNASNFLGQITFNSAPNVTDPASTGLIEPQGSHLGYVGSVWEFGVQLNTVATNITMPGVGDQGFLWAQNVVNWNDTGIHFVQDTWNDSIGSGFSFGYNSIYSACGQNTAGVNHILYVYGGVLQCVQGSVPVSPASYPVTVQLYNNASVNAQNRTTLTYGYRVTEAGTNTVYTGIASQVVFNNTDGASWQAPPAPPYTPGFTVDGFQTAPYGLTRDSEIVMVGDIGGDNAVFRSMNASVNLQYSNVTVGGWQNVPSAYDFGGDTGETSTGIAATWTSSHTEILHQGPAMLYGLWNAVPWGSVAAGSIHFSGTISPNYGFVFVSNTAPVTDPLLAGARDNMSWLPTTNSGSFSTYLPPVGAPWTTQYYVQAFADGYAELNGTAVTGTTTGYSLALTKLANPTAAGALRAPLYAFSNAQAFSLYNNLTGGTAAPYTFSDLLVNTNFSFNHVNDYGYATFEVFMAQGVTVPLTVNNVYQGPDSPLGTYIAFDYHYPSSGFVMPAPYVIGSVDNMTAQINIYGGVGDRVTNQTSFYVYGGFGPMTVLWDDTNAVAIQDNSTGYGAQGVFVGDSIGTTVSQETASGSALGVQDIGSFHTTVTGLTVRTGALGILALGSSDATYSWLNVSSAIGILAGEDYGHSVQYDHYYDLPGTIGLTVNELNVTLGGFGMNLTFSSQTTVNALSTYDAGGFYYGSGGAWLDGTFGTNFNGIRAYGGVAWGVDMYNATYTNYTNYVLLNSNDIASLWDASSYTNVNGLTQENYYVGILSGYDGGYLMDTSFSNVNIMNAGAGILLVYATATSFTNLNVSGIYAADIYTVYGYYYAWAGVDLIDSVGLTLTNIVGDGSTAVWLDGGSSVTGSNIQGTGVINWYAVELDYGSGATFTGVSGSDVSGGVYFYYYTDATVTGMTGTTGGIAVEADHSSNDVFTGGTFTANEGLYGVGLYESSNVLISNIVATGLSIGVEIYYGGSNVVTSVTATNDSVAVLDWYTTSDQISGITASNATATDLFGGIVGYWIGLPYAAVVTLHDTALVVSNVTGTGVGAALYDEDSYTSIVSGVTATYDQYGLYLNGTYNSLFTAINASNDYVGVLAQYAGYYYAEDNSITGSVFAQDTSYAIYFGNGAYYNVVWNNQFIGDNGATSTYNGAHIQAFSLDYNYFDQCTGSCNTGLGNYWADWHTYGSNGLLAPYPISGSVADFFPIGPAETFSVTFTESGLATGTAWSVTLNGVTESSTTSSLVFAIAMGSYSYFVGGVAGFTVSPASGSIVVSGGGSTYSVPVTFAAATYAVTLSEGGLASGTSWSATVNGQTQSTSGSSLVFYLADGSYAYSFGSVSGYNLGTNSSGTLTVSGAPLSLAASYSPTNTPSLASTSDLNNYFAVALAIAIVALVVALLALFLRRRSKPSENPPPAAWTPPPTSNSPPPSGGSGTSSWSEGPAGSSGSR